MSNEIKMLKIDHIEPVGLIAKDGADLATAFSNVYLVNAVNQIIDQDDIQSVHFLGSLAGQALAQMFTKIDIKQLDSVLSQIRHFVIIDQGH